LIRSILVVDSWPNSLEAGIDLHLDLDLTDGRRQGLEQALRAAVQAGRLAPGARLPASRRLAAELGLSRGTVRAAYDQLIAEGYLTARQGAGTTVAQAPGPSGQHARKPPPRRDQEPTPRQTGRATPRQGREASPRPDGKGTPRLDREGTSRLDREASPRPDGEGTPRLDWEGTYRHDLRPGRPDVSAFPRAAWLRSARRALGAVASEAYGYADPRGRIELRTALAEYLGRARGVIADPGRIVIVNGYVQGLALLTRVLADNGTARIAMEDPGSALHRAVARRNGTTVIPLPVDASGARTDLLGADADAVEVTPAHQYPTGHTLHPDRRRALTAWAHAHDGLIIENDYDGEFRYDRQPVGAVQGTAPEHVAYLGTASKTLAPGLRLGWMVLPSRLVGPVTEAKRLADHHTETLGQLTLADMISEHGYDRHIRASRLRYQRRRDLLLARLRPLVPHPLVPHGIAAGLHVMLPLPGDGPTEAEVVDEAAGHDLALGRLGDRWHTPGPHPQGLVIGYGTPPEHAYPAALDALARVLSAF
jgi:GntR family transcriptional regulator/MocR family aminotransferase